MSNRVKKVKNLVNVVKECLLSNAIVRKAIYFFNWNQNQLQSVFLTVI